jgi:oxygen-independent coproporphyrinogen-3 oxidase
VGEVRQAIALMHAHAPNWSLDLISSLPHQNMTNWAETLIAAVAAGPNHIAIYDLQVVKAIKAIHILRLRKYK